MKLTKEQEQIAVLRAALTKIDRLADDEDPAHGEDEWKHGYAAGLDDMAKIAADALSQADAIAREGEA